VSATADALHARLCDEKRDAMALAQALLSREDGEPAENEVFKAAYRPKDVPFAVPWSMDGLHPVVRAPDDGRRRRRPAVAHAHPCARLPAP